MEETTDQITIWKFEEAPARLRQLHRDDSPKGPIWIACVPPTIYDDALDKLIYGRDPEAAPRPISRHETSDGEIVYIGATSVDSLLLSIAEPPA